MENETSSEGINPFEQGNIGNTIVKDAEYDNDSSEKEEKIKINVDKDESNENNLIDEIVIELQSNLYKEDSNNNGKLIPKTEEDLKLDQDKIDNKYINLSNSSIFKIIEDPRIKTLLGFKNNIEIRNDANLLNKIITLIDDNKTDDNALCDILAVSQERLSIIEKKYNAQSCPIQLIIGRIAKTFKKRIKLHNKDHPDDIRYMTDFYSYLNMGKDNSTKKKWEYASDIFNYENWTDYVKHFRYGIGFIYKLVKFLKSYDTNKYLVENFIEKLKENDFCNDNLSNPELYLKYIVYIYLDLNCKNINIEQYKKLYNMGYEFSKNDIDTINKYSFISDINNAYPYLLLKTNCKRTIAEEVLKLIDKPDKNKTVSFFDWLKELKEKRYKNEETEITNKIVEENSVEKNGTALDKDQNFESQQNDNDGNKVTQKITSEEKIQCQANNCHNLSTKIESSDQKQLPIEQETENGEKQVESQQNVESEQQQSPQGQVINTQCQLTSQHTEKQNLQAEIENKREECYEYLITSLYDNLNNNPLDLKEKSNEIQYYTEEVVNMLLKAVNQLKKDVTI